MLKFHIKGFEACNDPYYFDRDYPVDITVKAFNRVEAVEKAEKILGHKIHRSTMYITISEE